MNEKLSKLLSPLKTAGLLYKFIVLLLVIFGTLLIQKAIIFNLGVFLVFFFFTIPFIIYMFIVSSDVKEGFKTYQPLITLVSVMIVVFTFLYNLHQTNLKIQNTIEAENSFNLQHAETIIAANKSERFAWNTFSVFAYRINWDYLSRNYSIDCVKSYASVIYQMEVANRIIESIIDLNVTSSLLTTEIQFKNRVENHKQFQDDLLKVAEKVKKLFEDILEKC